MFDASSVFHQILKLSDIHQLLSHTKMSDKSVVVSLGKRQEGHVLSIEDVLQVLSLSDRFPSFDGIKLLCFYFLMCFVTFFISQIGCKEGAKVVQKACSAGAKEVQSRAETGGAHFGGSWLVCPVRFGPFFTFLKCFCMGACQGSQNALFFRSFMRLFVANWKFV